jgi:hypothetical protein
MRPYVDNLACYLRLDFYENASEVDSQTEGLVSDNF